MKSPRFVEAGKPKGRIERLLESLTGTTDHGYHSRIKSAQLYDKSMLENPSGVQPMPVLPKTNSIEDYNMMNQKMMSESAHSKKFQNFV